MAASIRFSGQALVQHTRQGLNIRFMRNEQNLIQMKTKKPKQESCMNRKVECKVRKDCMVIMSVSNSSASKYPSPSDTINQFYKCINEKDLKKLARFISSDCFFEDLSFFKPFQGRKEILQFYKQLFTSMGDNVEFIVEEICEGNNTIGVNWHMEWKNYRIPFTRGYSFYELSRHGENFLISKAKVVVESPIKPGILVLGMLQIVTSLFDAFPEATEWCLKSPHVILQLLLRIYNMVLGPLITPVLAFYTNIGNFVAHVITFTLRIIYHIVNYLRQ